MSIRWKPGISAVALLAGFTGLVAPHGASAQTWANQAYKNRRTLTLSNPSGAALNTGDVVAFSYNPGAGPFQGKTRADSSDIHIYYWNGTTNTDLGQVTLDMGSVTGKILFQLGANIAAGSPNPYTVTNGGSSTFSATGGTSLGLSADDLNKTVSLGITFPFTTWNATTNAYQTTNYTSAVVSTNGWIAFDSAKVNAVSGPTHYGAFDDTSDTEDILLGRQFIAPLSGDLDTSVTGGDVFQDNSVAGQVTFRWAAAKFKTGGSGAVTLNFSATLTSSGQIIYKYGTPASATDVTNSPTNVNTGVAVGNPLVRTLQKLEEPQDFSGKADVTFAPQAASITQATGYYLYYNNSSETGARVAIPTSKLRQYAFNSDTDNVFDIVNDGDGDVFDDIEILDPSIFGMHNESAMVIVDDLTTSNPMGVEPSGTPATPEMTVYAKARSTDSSGGDSGEIAIMTNANINGAGYGLYANGLTPLGDPANQTASSAGLLQRVAHDSPTGVPGDYVPVGPSAAYSTPFWNFFIARSSVAQKEIQGKVYQKPDLEPGGFNFTYNPATLTAGVAGVTGYLAGPGSGATGEADNLFVDWMYVATNSWADNFQYTTGSEETLPPPTVASGQGVISGQVTDAYSSAQIGSAVPAPGVTVTIAGPGGPFVIPSDIRGNYQQTVTAGSYTVTFSSKGYTTQVINTTVAAGGTNTVNASLVAPELVTNPGMETPDTAPSGGTNVKPLGWYRRTFDTSVPPIANPNPDSVQAPWGYITAGGANVHSGTHAVSIAGSTNTNASNIIVSWDSEGSVANPDTHTTGTAVVPDPDGRGRGPLPAVQKGAQYLISAWVKKTGNHGEARLRIRDMASDDDGEASRVAGGTNGTTAVQDQSTDWKKLSVLYTAASNYLSVRLYGVDIPANEPVYWDDASITRVSLPTFTGVVLDSNGNPVSGAAVGVHETGATPGLSANGLSSPIGFGDTDALGRFAISFLPAGGASYVAQAWLDNTSATMGDGYAASANVPLQALGTPTAITYTPTLVANLALYKPVVAYSSFHTPNSLDGTAVAIPNYVTDGSFNLWQTDETSTGTGINSYPSPQFVIIDLGQQYSFAQISQISVLYRQYIPNHWVLRASATAPAAGITPQQALTYGSLLYESPDPSPAAGSTEPIIASAGQRTYNLVFDGNQYNRVSSIVTNDAFLNKPTARYLEFAMDEFLPPYTQVNIFEIRVEVPGGDVTGQVVDKNLAPVAGAVVGQHPDGPPSKQATTDSTGKYTITNLPTLGTYALEAHYSGSDASKVYAVSAPVTPTIVAGTTNTAPTIGIGDPATDLTSTTSASPAGLDSSSTPAMPASNAGDKNFNTEWLTPLLGDVPPALVVDADDPANLVADLGSSQSFNTVVVNWGQTVTSPFVAGWATDYAIQYANSNSTNDSDWTTAYATNYDLNGGYAETSTIGTSSFSRQVDALTLASPVTARFVRVHMTSHYFGDYLAIWELQVGNATQFTVPAGKAGDINKDNTVNLADVVAILKVAGGITALNSGTQSLANGDVNADGHITIIDAFRVAAYVSGKRATP